MGNEIKFQYLKVLEYKAKCYVCNEIEGWLYHLPPKVPLVYICDLCRADLSKHGWLNNLLTNEFFAKDDTNK